MEEEVSNNGGPWRARMNSCAPRQKEKKKILSLSSAFVFSLSGTPHIHLTILISALSSLASCSAFTAHVSLTYIIELRTHAPYTFPFNLNATFLLVKIPDNSLNFFQPHPTLEIDASLDPPSPFNISPRRNFYNINYNSFMHCNLWEFISNPLYIHCHYFFHLYCNLSLTLLPHY